MHIPEKHRELAHAEIDGAVIQAKGPDEWIPKTWTEWLDDDEYRIDPICGYAINKIPNKHRKAYMVWCAGGSFEFSIDGGVQWWKFFGTDSPQWDNFKETRPKPKTIKRWHWLFIDADGIFRVSPLKLSEDEIMEWTNKSGSTVERFIPETEQEFPA